MADDVKAHIKAEDFFALSPEHRRDIVSLLNMMLPEELHPDLVPCLCASGFGPDTVIDHPLLEIKMHSPVFNRRANFSYLAKREALKKALADKKWGSVLCLHERHYRFQALMTIKDQIIDDAEFWHLVGDVWTDTETVYDHLNDWKKLWQSTRPFRQAVMKEDEQAFLAHLPDVLTVYRGATRKTSLSGMSWSLDRRVAISFAKKKMIFQSAPTFKEGTGKYVRTGRVAKRDVLAYLNGRKEQEIVVLPSKVVVLDNESF